MSNLSLFIESPFTNWNRIHGYGWDADGTIIHHDVVLETSLDGVLLAAIAGRLSVNPPGVSGSDNRERGPISGSAAPVPDTIDLYLLPLAEHSHHIIFQEKARKLNGITAFAYLNVDRSSLETYLSGAEGQINSDTPLTIADAVNALVRGAVDLQVVAGQQIGQASQKGAAAGSRRFGFTVFSNYGPRDPMYVYNDMRGFVDVTQDLDGLLEFIPANWPLFSSDLSASDAIALTATSLYPMAALKELQSSHSLSAEQWRQVGDNQKELWRRRLLMRTGHADLVSTDPPFEFDNLDWMNLFQLEAVVEFYLNYMDPWSSDPSTEGISLPRSPWLATDGSPNPDYRRVDLLDPEGTNATVSGNTVTLDGTSDLTRVRKRYHFENEEEQLFDTLSLNNQLYKISGLTDRTITLEEAPGISGGGWPWRINLRPTLVIIDSFGGRLRGTSATVSGSTLTLDGSPDLTKLNKNFDTIYLPADTARPSRTYRITAYDAAGQTVTLDGAPVLDGGSSGWHIPAGVSGQLPVMEYNLTPDDITWGYDHYDGVLFLVYGGRIHYQYRWTSYTSHNFPPGDQQRSSMRGNKQYQYISCYSGLDAINYAFMVHDMGSTYDGVLEARFYFADPVTEDTADPADEPVDGGPGKTAIRLHIGYDGYCYEVSNRSGSAGCLVAPSFYQMRDNLVAHYQGEYKQLYHQQDPEAEKVVGNSHAKSKDLYNDVRSILWLMTFSHKLHPSDWSDKIAGDLYLIRPDEPPLGQS